jgi:hypothetical protein
MKTTSSCVLNSTAILDAINSHNSAILFEFHDNPWEVGLPDKWFVSRSGGQAEHLGCYWQMCDTEGNLGRFAGRSVPRGIDNFFADRRR